jgi:hypothetical protein
VAVSHGGELCRGRTQGANGQLNEHAVLLLAGKFKSVPSGNFYREEGTLRVEDLAVEGTVTGEASAARHAAQVIEHLNVVLAQRSGATKTGFGRTSEFIEALQQRVVEVQMH